MTDFLISAADLVFTGDTLLESTSILIQGGKIARLGTLKPSSPPTTFCGQGQLVMPLPLNAADPDRYPQGAVPLEPGRLRRVQEPAGHLVVARLTTEECRFRYGRRPLDVLADFGWLTKGVAILGLTDLNADELSRLVKAQVAVVHFPTQELLSGKPLPALRQWIDAGLLIGLGGDPLQEARQAYLLQRGQGQELGAAEAIALATKGSARCLGLPGGVIEEGAPAQLLLAPAAGGLEALLLATQTNTRQVVNPHLQRVPQLV